VIALAGFGFDADSVRATRDRPCVSFEAMDDLVVAFMKLIMDPLAMWVPITRAASWNSLFFIADALMLSSADL